MENGNKSANSAYQTWRLFSGSPLKKYEGHNNKELGLSTKFITPAQSQWVKDLASTSKHLINTKKMMNEDADKEAQRIFGSMSLDEFTQRYRDGELPSQDNPLVMSRMKKLYGQTVAGIAHTDFINRISSNEFNDKTPEEVDKLYYEHLQESYNEFKDAFGFTNGEDSDYNNGFWDSGYKGRLITIETHQKVTDSFNKDLSTTVELSNLSGLASESPNIEDAIFALNSSIEMGSLSTPEDMVKGVDTLATSVAYSSNAFDKDGVFILDKIRDTKVKGLNKTFGEVLGPKIEALRLKALENEVNQNFDKTSALTGKLERLVANADVASIEAMLDDELTQSKGFKTPRAKLIESARNRAIRKQEEENNKTASSINKKIAMGKALEILANPSTGKISENTVTGITKTEWDNAFKTLLDSIDNDTDKLNWALSVAERGSDIPNNPANTWLNDYFRETLSNIKRDARNLDANPNLDNGRGYAIWSEKAQNLFGAYSMNPNVLDSMVSRDSEGESTKLKVLAHLYASGMPYSDVLKGITQYEKMTDLERQNLNTRVMKTVKSFQIEDETYGRVDDPYSFSVVRSLALTYAKMNPNATESEAMRNAEALFKKDNIVYKGAYIPKSYFNVLGLETDPDVALQLGETALDTILKQDKKMPKDENVLYQYALAYDSVVVIDANTMNYVTSVTKKQLREHYKANEDFYKKKRKDIEKLAETQARAYKVVLQHHDYTSQNGEEVTN